MSSLVHPAADVSTSTEVSLIRFKLGLGGYLAALTVGWVAHISLVET